MNGDDRQVLQELLAAQERREPVALAVVIRDQGSVPRHAGAKMLVFGDGRTLGTIGGDRLGVLMRQRHVRRLALEVMTEVVQVALAEGVKLEKVSGTLDLEWIALTEAERVAAGSPGLLAKHTLLLAVGARYRRMRSSMLSAIERGRKPSVDFLNGEVVSLADKHGIRVPVNSLIQRTIHRIAAGELRPSLDLVRRIYDETRAAN